MRKPKLTLPQLMFVVATRAALGTGIGLLAGSSLKPGARRAAGATLALIGAATTIPAARMVLGRKSPWDRLRHAFA